MSTSGGKPIDGLEIPTGDGSVDRDTLTRAEEIEIEKQVKNLIEIYAHRHGLGRRHGALRVKVLLSQLAEDTHVVVRRGELRTHDPNTGEK